MENKSEGTIILFNAALSRSKLLNTARITAACAGVEGMTRVMATEWGKEGIKVTTWGFESLSHFSYSFKKMFGKAPSEI